MRISRAKAAELNKRKRGSQIAEFGAALVLVSMAIIIPSVGYSILPVRWIMAQEIVKSSARKLALSESFSESLERLSARPSVLEQLNSIGGIKVDTIKLLLKATKVMQPGQSITVEAPGKLGKDWLPDRGNIPCTYTLILEARVKLSPALLLPATAPHLPGINGPIPLILSAAHEWENLSMNPESGRYFINE